MSSIDPATLRAYQESEYRILGSVPEVLRIGIRSPDLIILHRAYQAICSAFITACNPFGLIVADRLNARQQQALVEEITLLGLTALPGFGVHPNGEWRAEPSFLVPGLDRAAATALGHRFEQNAIVWAGPDAVPELLLLR